MKTLTKKLSELKVYENNARDNSKAIPKVKKSILDYGYLVPIVIDSNNIIIAGHTRFAALLEINEQLGIYDEIVCVLAENLTPEQINQFRIVDNLVSDIADWDFTKLNVELDRLGDFSLDDFGFIPGFKEDIVIAEEEVPEVDPKEGIQFKIGPDTITMSEAEYHQWCMYIISTKGMTVVDFVREALEIDPQNRHFPQIEL